jgi:hypothetical protein
VVPPANVLEYDGIATLGGMLESGVLLLRRIFPVGRPIDKYGEFATLGWAHYIRAQNHIIAHGHEDVFLQNKMRCGVRGILSGNHENGSCQNQTQSPEFHRA